MSASRTLTVRDAGSHAGTGTGNRYDDRMVPPDVSDKTPSTPLLVARLHVDLCRLASAICPAGAAG
nr:putative leader peptide [Streptomyces montanisoli]